MGLKFRVSIPSWNTYNDRGDPKRSKWLRLEARFATDPDFDGEPGMREVWVHALCMRCGTSKDDVVLSVSQIKNSWNLSKSEIFRAIDLLAKSGKLLIVEDPRLDFGPRAVHARSTTDGRTHERTNERTNPLPSEGGTIATAAVESVPAPALPSAAPPAPRREVSLPNLDETPPPKLDLPQQSVMRPAQAVSTSNKPAEKRVLLGRVADLLADAPPIGEPPPAVTPVAAVRSAEPSVPWWDRKVPDSLRREPTAAELRAELGLPPAAGDRVVRDPVPAVTPDAARVVAESAPTVAAPEPKLSREDDAPLTKADPFAATPDAVNDVMRGLGLPLDYGLPEKRPAAPQKQPALAFDEPTQALPTVQPPKQPRARAAPKPPKDLPVLRGEEKFTPEQRAEAKTLREKAREAYAEAYLLRYGVLPTIAMIQNTEIKRFAEQVGADAPEVLRFYVGHVKQTYVEACHSLYYAALHAPALHTQWKMGRMVTRAESARNEVDASNRAAIMRVIGGGKTG